SGGGSGGGISLGIGSTLIVNCTVAGNAGAPGGLGQGSGGGILVGSGAQLTLENSLVAQNTLPPTGSSSGSGPDVSGAAQAGSNNNLIGINDGPLTGISAGVNGNRIGTPASPINPRLGPLADNGGLTQTMALLLGSPAINAGSNASIPPGVTTDQRGLPRIVGGTSISVPSSSRA